MTNLPFEITPPAAPAQPVAPQPSPSQSTPSVAPSAPSFPQPVARPQAAPQTPAATPAPSFNPAPSVPPQAAPAPATPTPAVDPAVTPAPTPSFSGAGSYAGADARATLDKILALAVSRGSSDIHFSTGVEVRNRIDGDLVPIPEFPEPLTKEWMMAAFKQIMRDDIYERYEKHHEADFAHPVENVGRFRVNAFQQQLRPGAVFRIIPTKIKTIEELNAPASLKEIARKPRGLILVTGPTGSGKSTTLAAMIDAINKSRSEHIMTIEDPVEFVHVSQKSLINQREVGADTDSFAEALKRVLRQDPDVILVGELRDPETISTALTAAETGHLVFGTLHTQSASKTIDRIIDSFPPAQQAQVKTQLADTLQAVIAQTLLKKIGGGRVMATEIMLRTHAIANMIREGKVSQIYSAIQAGAEHGMHTLDQDLMRLVKAGIISPESARPLMVTPSDLDSIKGNTSAAAYSESWEN